MTATDTSATLQRTFSADSCRVRFCSSEDSAAARDVCSSPHRPLWRFSPFPSPPLAPVLSPPLPGMPALGTLRGHPLPWSATLFCRCGIARRLPSEDLPSLCRRRGSSCEFRTATHQRSKHSGHFYEDTDEGTGGGVSKRFEDEQETDNAGRGGAGETGEGNRQRQSPIAPMFWPILTATIQDSGKKRHLYPPATCETKNSSTPSRAHLKSSLSWSSVDGKFRDRYACNSFRYAIAPSAMATSPLPPSSPIFVAIGGISGSTLRTFRSKRTRRERELGR